MKPHLFLLISAGASLLTAQPLSRRAEIMGGPGDRGRCTVEVIVDGQVEIELRGGDAVMRNLGGGPPQWRRLVCTSPIPPNPADFRFAVVNGRGHQQLVRGPREGAPAVVRIEDPQGGAGSYTFEISWLNSGFRPGEPPPSREDGGWYRERDEWTRGQDWRNRLFERVREDIEQIERVTWPGGSDQYRLERTKQELNELQGQMARGRFDDRELDDVIRSLDRVVDDNRMSPRDRDILRDDMRRLQELREHRR